MLLLNYFVTLSIVKQLVMKEIWKDVIGYEGLYQVSNFGNVRSVDRVIHLSNGQSRFVPGKTKVLRKNNQGYSVVGLYDKDRQKAALVHRLVATAHIPNPEGKPCIDHIDGNRTNNNVDNLRWCTQKENCENPITLNRFREKVKRGEEHHCYGKPRPKEAIEKFSRTMKSKVHTIEEHESLVMWAKTCRKVRGGEHPKARRIEQYSLDGKLLRTWDSIADAARFYGKRDTLISQNLRGVGKTAFGYIWKYASENEEYNKTN